MENWREALDVALNEVKKRFRNAGLELSRVAKVTYFLFDLSLRAERTSSRSALTAPTRAVGRRGQREPFDGKCVIDVIAHR